MAGQAPSGLRSLLSQALRRFQTWWMTFGAWRVKMSFIYWKKLRTLAKGRPSRAIAYSSFYSASWVSFSKVSLQVSSSLNQIDCSSFSMGIQLTSKGIYCYCVLSFYFVRATTMIFEIQKSFSTSLSIDSTLMKVKKRS